MKHVGLILLLLTISSCSHNSLSETKREVASTNPISAIGEAKRDGVIAIANGRTGGNAYPGAITGNGGSGNNLGGHVPGYYGGGAGNAYLGNARPGSGYYSGFNGDNSYGVGSSLDWSDPAELSVHEQFLRWSADIHAKEKLRKAKEAQEWEEKLRIRMEKAREILVNGPQYKNNNYYPINTFAVGEKVIYCVKYPCQLAVILKASEHAYTLEYGDKITAEDTGAGIYQMGDCADHYCIGDEVKWRGGCGLYTAKIVGVQKMYHWTNHFVVMYKEDNGKMTYTVVRQDELYPATATNKDLPRTCEGSLLTNISEDDTYKGGKVTFISNPQINGSYISPVSDEDGICRALGHSESLGASSQEVEVEEPLIVDKNGVVVSANYLMPYFRQIYHSLDLNRAVWQLTCVKY
jgi:hypothetical protein